MTKSLQIGVFIQFVIFIFVSQVNGNQETFNKEFEFDKLIDLNLTGHCNTDIGASPNKNSSIYEINF